MLTSPASAGVGGIGGALAMEFHKAGFRVFAAARRPDTVAPLVSLGIESVTLDVTSDESISSAVAHVSELTDGKLDMLVNNAGAAVHVPALDLDIDGAVKNMFEVNVFGVMRMVKAFSGMLIKAEGCIVNIGSIAPIVPLVFSSAYNATKAALHAYGDCLRIELAPFKYGCDLSDRYEACADGCLLVCKLLQSSPAVYRATSVYLIISSPMFSKILMADTSITTPL